MALTKATYYMIANAPANVRDYGAIGDGTTDDTVAIKAAIAAATQIFFPAGTYKVTQSLNLSSGQYVFGVGKDSMIDMSVDDDGHVFGIVGATGVPVTGVTIENIAMDCNNTINLNGIGIAYAQNCFVDNVWVFNAGRKAFTMQYEVFDNIISNCYCDGGEATLALITLEDPTLTNQCQRNIITNIAIETATDWVLALDGADNCVVSNITCAESLRGIQCFNGQRNSISSVSIGDCTNGHMEIDNFGLSTFDNIVCLGNTTNEMIKIGTTAPGVFNNNFTNCEFAGSQTVFTYNAFLDDNKFIGCVFTTTLNSGYGIGIAANSIRNTFDLCQITVGTVRAFSIAGTNTTISNCTITSGTTGVHSEAAFTNAINNKITASPSYAIEFTTATDSLLVGNYKSAGTVDSGIRATEYGNNWNPSVTYGSAAPVSGTYNQGAIVYNNAPVSGGNIGWVCTTTGTPGTWKTFGTIA